MPDVVSNLTRRSALKGVVKTDRFGYQTKDGVGIVLSLCKQRSTIAISARNNKAEALSQSLKKQFGIGCPPDRQSESKQPHSLHWVGPQQYYLVSRDGNSDELLENLSKTLKDKASLVDQSHGRLTINVSGKNACDLLAKGTAVDLHNSIFPVGACTVTEMAHVVVHIVRIGDDEFEVSLFRGFAESFWEWLCEMSLEYGYQVAEAKP